MYSISIENFEQWRRYARILLERNISPEKIVWLCEKKEAVTLDMFNQDELFSDSNINTLSSLPIIHHELSVPKAFIRQAENVACFRDKGRWSLLYTLVWRLLFEDRNVLADRCDPIVARFFKMQKIIARDKHKMEAFVRFKRIVQNTHLAEQEYYVAWFEPEHFIIPIKAPFFVKRFSNMNWSILSPDCCAHWDQKEVHFTEGVTRPTKIDDDIEALWLSYYKSIFNPARLKVKAMQSEMPKKYWHNLPEAALIPDLIRSATQQMENMVEKGSSEINKSCINSKFVKQMHKQLRDRPLNSKVSHVKSQ